MAARGRHFDRPAQYNAVQGPNIRDGERRKTQTQVQTQVQARSDRSHHLTRPLRVRASFLTFSPSHYPKCPVRVEN